MQYTLEFDESARDFYVEFISTHARLDQILKNTFSIKNQSEMSDRELLNELTQVAPRPSRRFYLPLLGIGFSIVIAICVLIFNLNPPSYASVIDADRAMTRSQVELTVGKRLETQVPYLLEQGNLELLLETGTKVFIQSPAAFEILGENEISVVEGKLVARVTTPAGKGFTVNTPEGAVVDLGTLFGVEIERNGDSSVQVFQGEVELNHSQGKKSILPAGKAMRSDAGRKQWKPTEKLSREFYAPLEEKERSLLPEMVFIDHSRLSVFGMDQYRGVRYLMHTEIPLKERLGAPENQLPEWNGVAAHFVIVHFDEAAQRWQMQGNERALPLQPDSTDTLLARIEEVDADNNPGRKKVTYFSGRFGTVHGIQSGYQSSDLQLLPDTFEKLENSGDYSIKGSYLIRKPE